MSDISHIGEARITDNITHSKDLVNFLFGFIPVDQHQAAKDAIKGICLGSTDAFFYGSNGTLKRFYTETGLL